MSSLEQLSLLQRVGDALVGYAQYLLALLLSACPPWSYRRATAGLLLAAGSGCLLVALSIASRRYRRNHPYFLVGGFGCWEPGSVIGLVQIRRQAIADRYTGRSTHRPLLGRCVRTSLARAGGTEFPSPRTPPLAASTFWPSSRFHLARHRDFVWAGRRGGPQNDFALASMGLMRERQQQFVEAESYVRKALTVAPFQGPSHALTESCWSDFGVSTKVFGVDARHAPVSADGRLLDCAGDALVKLSRASEAEAVLDEAVRCFPTRRASQPARRGGGAR